MSTLEVNKITPQGTGTTVTLGDSGDSIDITSGATVTNFKSTGIDDNATSTALTINSSGNLGVGTASPSFSTGTGIHVNSSTSDCRIHITNSVTGTGAGDGAYIFSGSDSTFGLLQAENADMRFYTTGIQRMRIDGSGNTLHEGGTYVLAVNSGTYTWSQGTDGNSLNFYEGGGTRKGYLTLGGTWTNTSDRALKENIVDIPYGLSEIMQLQPRRYNVIGYEPDQIGFIAQEVEGIIPELVDGVEGEKGLAYSNMTSLLTKGIQELKTENDSLKTKVETLETTVANLTARLEALENA